MKAIIKQEIEISPDIKEGDKVIFKYNYEKSSLIFPLEFNIMKIGNHFIKMILNLK
jgi:hypothetical protein